MSKILHLTLKKKWFDMIASGEKKEEYRGIKDYWCKRFCNKHWQSYEREILYQAINKYYDAVVFRNGYSKSAREITLECLGISIGVARPEWSDNWQGDVFIIKLGKILKQKL